MDDFTRNHLESWLVSRFRDEQVDEARAAILSILDEHPDLMSDGRRGWPEVYELAIRATR